MIPNVIHFIFGLREDFGGKPFSFIYYLAVKSAYECNKPRAIKFYYKHEPSGEWWGKTKPYLTLVKVEPPEQIFGNRLCHVAHQADVLRLEILIREGGIYLDMDTLCLNSFSPLLSYGCVMGRQAGRGLCNAVILAEPGSDFLKSWYAEYKSFRSQGRDQFWDEHSVQVPARLAEQNPKSLHIEDAFAFFWPMYTASPIPLWNRPVANRFDRMQVAIKKGLALAFLKSSYSMHLWESFWWEEYLSRVTPQYLETSADNFARLGRRFMKESDGRPVDFMRLFRPFLKKLIAMYFGY